MGVAWEGGGGGLLPVLLSHSENSMPIQSQRPDVNLKFVGGYRQSCKIRKRLHIYLHNIARLLIRTEITEYPSQQSQPVHIVYMYVYINQQQANKRRRGKK